MLKRKVLLLFSLTSIGISVLLPHTANSDVLAQTESNHEKWQQPYTPTRLEWLFANLPGSSASINCVGTTSDENGQTRWIASYQWFRLGDGLSLFIDSDQENLRYCVSLAFEELRYAAFQMGLNPPNIELVVSSTDENGNQVSALYTCSVPAKTSVGDYNTGKFEDNCSLDLFDI